MKKAQLDKIINIIREKLNEETPTMALGHWKIAGTVEAGDDPPVRKKKKYIYMKGVRKLWKQENGGAN